MSNNILIFFVVLFLASCSSTRDLVYLSNLNNKGEYTETINNKIEPKIQPDDMLSITVSSLNPESNMLFNSGILQQTGSNSAASVSPRINEGYLVDKNGAINFPVLGSVELGGLTKEEATKIMTAKIKNEVKNPIVNIRFLNFKITIVGEVNNPSSFTIPTERVNVIEALGLAGDITAFGRRDNILIIREMGGIRSVVRVNLNDKSILNSPYYYLQQNDIVYIKPAKVKSLQGSSSTFYLPLVSAAVSILSIILIIVR